MAVPPGSISFILIFSFLSARLKNLYYFTKSCSWCYQLRIRCLLCPLTWSKSDWWLALSPSFFLDIIQRISRIYFYDVHWRCRWNFYLISSTVFAFCSFQKVFTNKHRVFLPKCWEGIERLFRSFTRFIQLILISKQYFCFYSNYLRSWAVAPAESWFIRQIREPYWVQSLEGELSCLPPVSVEEFSFATKRA